VEGGGSGFILVILSEVTTPGSCQSAS
jgi:hypothetical protein